MNFLADRQFWGDIANNTRQAAGGLLSATLGAPVDIATMVMRPFGYKVDDKKVVGSSEHIAGLLGLDSESIPYKVASLMPTDATDLMKYGGLLAAGSIKGVKSPKKTKYELAHEVAQRNAAKPIAEGGLGLPPDNTAAQRAEAMGFGPNLYHGSERLDRIANDWQHAPKRATSGPMPFLTDEAPVASNYAKNKRDTSLAAQDTGEVKNYFTIDPKEAGLRMRSRIPVENTWGLLTPEQRAVIQERTTRVGYENPAEAAGPLVLHPPGVNGSIASNDHWNYITNREARGNQLAAIRSVWHESGETIGDEAKLNDIYRLAGYPYKVSDETAPWFQAPGVLTARVRSERPLNTSDADALKTSVIPALEEAFKRDRTRKAPYGADAWDKTSRYTPKEWLAELKQDVDAGRNSYVWTSIPDKVSGELRRLGFDTIIDAGGKGGGNAHQVVIPLNHNQVRSQFAAFDPARKNEADLLGYATLPTLGLAGLLGLGGLAGLSYLEQR